MKNLIFVLLGATIFGAFLFLVDTSFKSELKQEADQSLQVLEIGDDKVLLTSSDSDEQDFYFTVKTQGLYGAKMVGSAIKLVNQHCYAQKIEATYQNTIVTNYAVGPGATEVLIIYQKDWK